MNIFYCLIAGLACMNVSAQPVSQKAVEGSSFAVVCASPFASREALQIMKKGGNAFDAAITAQWVLAVVYPQAGNLGGGGFMIARTSGGKNICFDFREVAPLKAGQNMFLDSLGNPVPGLSQESLLASGVPGSVAGIFAMHRYANLPMPVLMDAAIRYAEKGFPVSERMARELNGMKADFLKANRLPVAFVKNKKWKAGDLLIQPDLANTLKRISKNGAGEFYSGETGRLLVEEMKAGGGIISREDLLQYKISERVPMKFDYKGYEVITMPLPSSGGIILNQLMTIAKDYRLDTFEFHSPCAVQLVVEAERRAYADRSFFLGDPDFVKVPVSGLTDAQYLKNRMGDFSFNKAGSSNMTQPGLPHESEETTHISIIDSFGNAAAVTTTLNDSYGSRKVVSGAGFLLNNEMDDFSVKAGVPNLYGATGGSANAIAPRKKMLSSMTPTIVLKNGKPVIVAGTPGGTTIPTSVFQTIVNLLDFKLSPEEAVNAPKFHHQWTPDKVFVEKDFPAATAEKLRSMGYVLEARGGIGRTELIVVMDGMSSSRETRGMHAKGSRQIKAVADKRGDDDAQAE